MIMIGGAVRQDRKTFRAHLESVTSQEDVRDDLVYAYVDDNDERYVGEELSRAGVTAMVREAPQRPEYVSYGTGGLTHDWGVEAFDWVARLKQGIMDSVRESGVDWLWLVDSDLIVGPSTLGRLLRTAEVQVADVVFGVFWTDFSSEGMPVPQVWSRHPGGADAGLVSSLAVRGVERCWGGGACTLISRAALERGVRYWPRLGSLPLNPKWWQGEDRTFCLVAEVLGLTMVADGGVDIFHAYHPIQREDEALASALERVRYRTPHAPVLQEWANEKEAEGWK